MSRPKHYITSLNKGLVARLRHRFFSINIPRFVFSSAAIIIAAQAFFCAAVVANAIIPAAPKLNAISYALVDYDSERVIAAHAIDQRLPPASLTKVMVVYVVAHELELNTIQLEDQVTISEKAWRTPGSKMFIEVGKKVSVKDLLTGIIVQSGNDASVALAEFVSGSETAFVDLMNQHAKKLGLTDTHFVNCTGLPDPQHYTTAKDLAILARALIRDFPTIYSWHATRMFSFNGIKQRNRNRLLWLDHSVDGIKTGHTEAAGYCLLASAVRDDMRLISVVMGAASLADRSKASLALLNYGFRFYQTHLLYNSGESIDTALVWKGAAESVALGLDEAIYITIPRGQYTRLQSRIDLAEKITAPIAAGDRLGTVHIVLDEATLLSRPLVALQPVTEGSFLHRVSDSIRLFFK